MKKLILLFAFLLTGGITLHTQEKIENQGAITIDTASSLAPNAGTIEYRSGNFRGFDGSIWKNLDNPAYIPPAPSFAYAWLSDTAKIPVNQWTKIHFNQVAFDINGEFRPYTPGLPFSYGSFFPNEPGFYQVTARCEYEVEDYESAIVADIGPYPLESRSYVSIAVFTGIPNEEINPQPPIPDFMYSQGNNLQIAYGPDDNLVQGTPLNRNNAPNVSTIVEVKENETISIYGFWYQTSGIPGSGGMPFQVAHDPGGSGWVEESPAPETLGPAPSRPDKSKVYVTIHKVFP